MSTKIADIFTLPILQNVKIITGTSGWQNTVSGIGILDYEYIENTQNQFAVHELVISSCLFAKDDETLLISAIKHLIEIGVAALGIKTVYFKDLPEEIIAYAKEHSFCIFLFDNSIFFEDIITAITDLTHQNNVKQLLEGKIRQLCLLGDHHPGIRQTALEINPFFKEHLLVFYYDCPYSEQQEYLLKQTERLKYPKSCTISIYENGVLFINTADKPIGKEDLSLLSNFHSQLNVKIRGLTIGVSKELHSLSQLDRGIKQAIYAAKIGRLQTKSPMLYCDIGFYKMLLPYLHDPWLKDFYGSLLQPLQDYDRQYGTNLLPTAVSYVNNHGNIKKTATALFQHENTVRYRISKIKEIVNLSDEDDYFQEQLLLAIKIYQLQNETLK